MSGDSNTPWSSLATRWIRRLAVFQFALLVFALCWLTNAIFHCPEPIEFGPRQTYAGVIDLKRAMIDDLQGKPALRTFVSQEVLSEGEGGGDDYQFIGMLVEWGKDDQDDPREMERLSERIIYEYKQEFAVYKLNLEFLLGTGLAAAFCSLFLICVQRFSLSLLMLLVSFSASPVTSELLFGRDLGEVFVYSLPVILLSISMFVLAFVGFWSTQFQRHPSTQDAWLQIGLGVVALTLGITLTVIEVMDGARLSYKMTQGLGACIAAGLWCLFGGLRDLLKKNTPTTKTANTGDDG